MKLVLAARKQYRVGTQRYNKLFSTLKFEAANITSPNCQPNCTDTAGNGAAGVTFCGACINVTELGNIAYGYAADPLIATMIWGGFFAEVVYGRGFNKQSELVSALMGYRYQLDGGATPICTFFKGGQTFGWWQTNAIINTIWAGNSAFVQTQKQAGILFPIDICAMWVANTKLGPWDIFVKNALTAAATPGAALTSNTVANCNNCPDVFNGPNVVIAADGTASFPKK